MKESHISLWKHLSIKSDSHVSGGSHHWGPHCTQTRRGVETACKSPDFPLTCLTASPPAAHSPINLGSTKDRHFLPVSARLLSLPSGNYTTANSSASLVVLLVETLPNSAFLLPQEYLTSTLLPRPAKSHLHPCTLEICHHHPRHPVFRITCTLSLQLIQSPGSCLHLESKIVQSYWIQEQEKCDQVIPFDPWTFIYVFQSNFKQRLWFRDPPVSVLPAR